jgi:aryl-alcohol dehydrogenase-like predicted oxidoreductase
MSETTQQPIAAQSGTFDIGGELTVYRLGFGAMQLTGKGIWGEPDDPDECRSVLKRAVELGVNFIDTADSYGPHVSERLIAEALHPYPDDLVIATKAGLERTGPNQWPMNGDPKHLREACEGSLKRLKVDTIDLYQLHRFDPAVPIEETLRALDDLVRAGKVRYIGASSGMAWRFAQALSASERHGWARFVSMQNHYNLLYREEEREMLPLCVEEGIGVIPWSPLARGTLARARPAESRVDAGGTTRAETDDFAKSLYDQPGDWDVVDAVERVAQARGTGMAEVALAWLLGRPAVVAPIVGATKPHHLEAAVRALDVHLDAEERATLEAPYRPHPVRGF